MSAPPLYRSDPILVLTAILIGIAVPFSQIGYAVTTTALAVACVLIMLRRDRMARLRGVASTLRSPVGIAAAVLFLAWVPSLIVSIDPAKSLQVWLRMIAYLSLGVLVWSFLKTEEAAIALCGKTLIIASLVTVVLAMINFSGMTELIGVIRLKSWSDGLAVQTMKHYASPAACLLPVLVMLGWRLGGAWRMATFFAAAGLLLFIVLTRGGAAMAGLALGVGFVGIAVLAGRRPMAMVAAWLLVVALFLVWLAWFARQGIPDYADAASYPVDVGIIDTHRQIIWNYTLSRFVEAPFFGYGIDAINKIADASTAVLNPFRVYQQLIPSHPHNWIIEVLAETGVVGLVAMLVALSVLVARIFVPGRQRSAAGQLTLIALFAIFFGSSLANFSFWASWWQITFIALWAMVSALPAVPSVRPPTATASGGEGSPRG